MKIFNNALAGIFCISEDRPGERLCLQWSGEKSRLEKYIKEIIFDRNERQLTLRFGGLSLFSARRFSLPFERLRRLGCRVQIEHGGPLQILLSIHFDAGTKEIAWMIIFHIKALDLPSEALDLTFRIALILGWRGYLVTQSSPTLIELSKEGGKPDDPYRGGAVSSLKDVPALSTSADYEAKASELRHRSPWTPNNGKDILNAIWGDNKGGLYIAGCGRLYCSADWGRSWFSWERWGLHNSIWGLSQDEIYTAGWNLLSIKDNGRTANVLSDGFGKLYAIWGSTEAGLYAVGEGGLILHSIDGGNSWDRKTPTQKNLFGVWGYEGSVYAVGADATVLRTTDAGRSWSPCRLHRGFQKGPFLGIWGTPDRGLYIAAGQGTILHSRRGEESWVTKNTELYDTQCKEQLYGIYGNDAGYPTNRYIYAVGDKGKIFRSSGAGWEAYATYKTQTLRAVWVDEEGTAYIVGDNETFMKIPLRDQGKTTR